MIGMRFSSQSDCESTAMDIVGTAIRDVRDKIEDESRIQWDTAHLHDISPIFLIPHKPQ